MKKFSSIFHKLQKEGAPILEINNLQDDIEMDTDIGVAPFLEKISNSYRDPFPVLKVTMDDARDIFTRFHQIQAADGVELSNPDMSPEDRKAATTLIFEELGKAHIPAKRFGLEIDGDTGAVGIVFEAVKNLGNGTTRKTEHYTISEFGTRKLSDVNAIRIYFMWELPEEPPVPGTYLMLNEIFTTISFAPGKMDFGHPYSLAGDSLTAEDTNLTQRDIFQTTQADLDLFQTQVIDLSLVAFQLLWILERDPKLLIGEKPDFSGQNQLRRLRGFAPFSPVHLYRVDKEELRCVQSQRAAEIAEALTAKGKYQIPGLILVSKPYERKDGTVIKAYARCADEVVRIEATRLLQPENRDGQKLADLVDAFGHRTTQAYFGNLSQLHAVRVRPS